MNKDQMELFEQMQLVFAKKDDIEKLRQGQVLICL
jgi:hypothetical protein